MREGGGGTQKRAKAKTFRTASNGTLGPVGLGRDLGGDFLNSPPCLKKSRDLKP